MSAKEEKLLSAKNRLCAALGESGSKVYMSNLKMWFRKAWTKEQFDLECRKLLTPEQKHLHNQFFLAILNKITYPTISQNALALSSSANESKTTSNHTAKNSLNNSNSSGGGSKKRKRASKTSNERAIFEPIDLYDFLPDEDMELRPPSTPLPQPRFAAQELFLPDNGLILGRLLVAAWENGLSNADESVCELIVIAVQVILVAKPLTIISHVLNPFQTFLKNILAAIIKSRKNYRSTNQGNFLYDFGQPLSDPFVRNTTSKRIIDDHPFEIDKEIASTNMIRRINDESIFLSACENMYDVPVKSRITVLDLYKALQDRNVIPCHSVYANNIERISQMLN